MNQWIEIVGAVIGIVYLYLEIKKRNAMWIVGILMSLFYLVIFLSDKLYASMGIQIYYLIVSIYGLIQWKKSSSEVLKEEGKIVLKKMKIFEFSLSIVLTAVVFLLLWFVLARWSQDPRPVLDALFSSLSILGTYWLSRSYLPQWIVWIIADAVGIYLYASEGLYPTALLYLFYTASAFYGFFYWRKKGIILK